MLAALADDRAFRTDSFGALFSLGACGASFTLGVKEERRVLGSASCLYAPFPRVGGDYRAAWMTGWLQGHDVGSASRPGASSDAERHVGSSFPR